MAEVPVAAATTVVEVRAVEVVLRARAAAATVMEAVATAMVAIAEVHAEVSTAASWARAAAVKAVRVARVAHN